MSHTLNLAAAAGGAPPTIKRVTSQIPGPSVLGVLALQAKCEDGSDINAINTNGEAFVKNSRLNRVHSLRQLNAMASKRKI